MISKELDKALTEFYGDYNVYLMYYYDMYVGKFYNDEQFIIKTINLFKQGVITESKVNEVFEKSEPLLSQLNVCINDGSVNLYEVYDFFENEILPFEYNGDTEKVEKEWGKLEDNRGFITDALYDLVEDYCKDKDYLYYDGDVFVNDLH